MDTTHTIAIIIGISAAVAIAANMITLVTSSRPSKEDPLLYTIPGRWGTVGGPVVASIATALSAAGGIASLLLP